MRAEKIVSVKNDIVTKLGWLGVSEEELRRRLVAQFSFKESDWTHLRYGRADPKTKHYDDYKKPDREDLATKVHAEIVRIGAARKRPKILVGAVVKRIYATYPATDAFKKMMEKRKDAEEEARLARKFPDNAHDISRHGRKGNL